MNQKLRVSRFFRLPVAALSATFIATCAYAQAPAVGAGPIHDRMQAARANPELEKKLFILGRKVAAVCANCHGDKGHSNTEEIPVLAGQNPDYLIEQSRKYIDGRRRDTFMQGVLKALSVDEIAGMSLYYAAQAVEPQPTQPAALVEKGKQYFGKVCVACHGADARGTAHMPRLAGQHPGYVLATLQHFKKRDGIRSNPEMESIAQGMSEADMKAVAAYVAALP